MSIISTKTFKSDLSAGLTVFLVAIPLCLGIAIASGAPPIAGIISGILGGIVVGILSNSPLSVSGPAAGLVAAVIMAIEDLGSYPAFLLVVVLAGVLQLVMSVLKLGSIANYIPSSVIKGMLAGIGVLIIKKEIPHFVGYDADKAFSFAGAENEHAFSDLMGHFDKITMGPLIAGIVALVILILYPKIPFMKKMKFLPASLIAVLSGILVNQIFIWSAPSLVITGDHLVEIPSATNLESLAGFFTFPDFSQWNNPKLYYHVAIVGIIASVETLLCLEAVDKLDPHKRRSSGNRELFAQGVGNTISGLIGGLPITSVIVRSSANVGAGGETKQATIIHGIMLVLAILFLGTYINLIPLSVLAAVLLVIGYRLCRVPFFKEMWKKGKYQFWPFVITFVAIALTNDLLKGVGIGLAASIFALLRSNLKNSYFFHKEEHGEGDAVYMHLSEEVSFLNKASIKKTLDQVPEGVQMIIDASHTEYIDYDVLEIIRDFQSVNAVEKNIQVSLVGFKDVYDIENSHSVISKPKETMVKKNIKKILN